MAKNTGSKPAAAHARHVPEPPPLESLAPELRAPLARFAGEPPPAPAWFSAALARTPERLNVATPRGALEALAWGEVGKPGLLLVHGNFASADWWSFIAPFFAAHYRVAAMSLAGMGGSDWRDIYGFDGFAEDAEAVAQAAGLHAAGAKPIYIAHSFGGGLVLHAAATNPEQMAGAILVDTGFRPPPPQALEARLQQIAALRARAADQLPPRGFPSLAAAIARFRLLPAQAAENLYILDHIARTSFRRLPAAAGEAEVWTWKYDPDIAAKIDYPGRTVFFASQPEIAVPMAHLYGQYSQISAHGEEARGGPFPAHGLEVEIPEANHHVMIDQPLALVSALRTVLAAWRA